MDDLTRFIKGYNGDLEEIPRKAVIVLATEVIVNTPVDEGTLRGDWSIGVNAEPPARNGTTTALSEAELAQALSTLGLGGHVRFYNQMPYARRIEYEGWSPQAKNGMLQPAVKRWDLIVEAVAKNGS